ncbi:hypothetical protein [Streptomyces torulosus]|uniref:hypothetical protein n=1 Tax=Streptomyces torulosus TaxID=68276 RepID=UPI0006EBBEB1|nr:hypothetical protein [Streptomyces torulosus]
MATVGFRPYRPPRDPQGFEAFLTRIRDPTVSDFVRTAQPAADVAVHRRTGNVRRHDDRMKRWPAGLLALGDALCAFHPVYGQGITVSATGAVAARGAASLACERQSRQISVQAVFSRWPSTAACALNGLSTGFTTSWAQTPSFSTPP